MSATAAEAVKLAASQDGVQEVPSGSNRVKYATWYGVIGPWCAMYLSWIWWSIGLRFTGAQSAKGWASAESMRQWFKAHDRLVTTPKAGDVVFWHFPGEHAGANHVSLFVSAAGSTVTTWDGNTSTSSDRDGGHVEKRTRPRSYVIGFGRPPYVAPIPGSTAPKPPAWWKRTLTLTSPYMTGPDVEAAAKRLIAHGHDVGTPLNVFGPRMDAATHAFQHQAGITEDGDIGPTTAYKLGG